MCEIKKKVTFKIFLCTKNYLVIVTFRFSAKVYKSDMSGRNNLFKKLQQLHNSIHT